MADQTPGGPAHPNGRTPATPLGSLPLLAAPNTAQPEPPALHDSADAEPGPGPATKPTASRGLAQESLDGRPGPGRPINVPAALARGLAGPMNPDGGPRSAGPPQRQPNPQPNPAPPGRTTREPAAQHRPGWTAAGPASPETTADAQRRPQAWTPPPAATADPAALPGSPLPSPPLRAVDNPPSWDHTPPAQLSQTAPAAPAGPPVRRSTVRSPLRGPASQSGEEWQLDWGLVRTFRTTAAQQLAAELRDRPGVDEDTRRELGRDVIRRLLADHNQTEASSGRGLIDVASEAVLAQAIFDALFGLGRLQPLVDDPDIENIEVTGHDQVRLIYADGRIEVGPPVADSDEELIEFLAFLAARRGEGERPFGFANPRLHLALPGRARLTAAAWITQRPTIRIRRQRLTNVALPELREVGSISYALEAFLHAAVQARRSIVVSGEMGSGKTTMVRALAAAIPPYESIATLETEYELYLDELPQRQLRPVEAWEARPGSGERGPDGRPAGAITLEDVFEDVLRHNLDRVIVGEVRGREAMAMFKCMQAGAGSLSTIHARNARDTIGRLITCVVAADVPEAYANRLVAQNIDLIVHLSARVDPRTGQRRRHVAEVIEVTPGEEGRPAINLLFAPGPDGRAVPRHAPSERLLDDLTAAGFHHDLLNDPDGWVPQPGPDHDPLHHGRPENGWTRDRDGERVGRHR